jgi:cyclophilin family peptidyl-prolyl cis-trans isomerase
MARYGTRWTWVGARSGLVALVLGASLFGCNDPPGEPEPKADEAPRATAPPSTASSTTNPANPTKSGQTFAEATRAEPPSDWQRPPDTTMTGASVGKLYTEVVRLWDSVQFVSDHDKRLAYTAKLDTELGPIVIALRPEIAPNHVRNFIALSRAGYYNGLVFERAVHEKAEGQPDLELIEAGCPVGTGEFGYGSIGYWLKPEFNEVVHEAGTVGACHSEELDTACCKFYVSLSKAPLMDNNFTVFGKVIAGLDVARRIFSLPVRNDAEYPEGDRPEKPVVIRKVTIEVRELEN